MSYDALDREQVKLISNGVSIEHSYDPAGREVLLEQRKANGIAIAAYTATYDDVGNRLNVAELDGSRVTYVYDASYQLVSEERSGSTPLATSFVYDGLGNRLSQTKDGVLTIYTHDAANAVLSATTGASVTSFAYDANSNRALTNAAGVLTTYSWDEENRMAGVLLPSGGRETFTYSGDGQRRSRSTPDEEVQYLWDEDNVLQELDGSGNLIAHYTDFPGYWGGLTSLFIPQSTPAPSTAGMGGFNTAQFNAVLFNQAGQSPQSGSFFYLFDQSASTRYLLDSSAAMTDSELFAAFGQRLATSGNTRNPRRYQGQAGPITDAPNRITMGVRIYDPEMGQWYSIDPIGFLSDSYNLYGFTANNPVNAVDPWGLAVPGAVVVGGGVIVTAEVLAIAAGVLGISIWACIVSGPCLQLASDIARGTPDLFPAPPPQGGQPRRNPPDRNKPRRKDKRQRKESECKKNYRNHLNPNQLLGYPFAATTKDSAIRQTFEAAKDSCDANLRKGAEDSSTGGPCIGVGRHINTYYASGRRSGDHAGSIVCCPTCRDKYPGVELGWKCAFIPKRR